MLKAVIPQQMSNVYSRKSDCIIVKTVFTQILVSISFDEE